MFVSLMSPFYISVAYTPSSSSPPSSSSSSSSGLFVCLSRRCEDEDELR